MAHTRTTAEETRGVVMNAASDALEQTLSSDCESGAESFLTDEEVAYQEGLDPVEDVYYNGDDDRPSSPPDSSSVASTSSAAPSELSPLSEKTTAELQLSRKRRATPRKVNYALSSDEEEEEKVLESPRRKKTVLASRRGQARSKDGCRSRSLLRPQSVASATSWNTEDDPDTDLKLKKFCPARNPGHQLSSTSTYTALDLFKLFFTDDVLQTMCRHTNKQAAKNIAKGKKYSWTDLTTREFQKFMGLNFYFALVKLNAVQDYWKTSSIFSVTFPAKVMPRNRYSVISWNVHMSDPDEDVKNDRKKGTAEYDRLFRLKPLMVSIQDACKAHYHPRQNLSIDERMVATKANMSGMIQYMKAKPVKWGFKLFVLADSSNGYTVDFSVYTGKTQFPSGIGLAYDSVMSLIKPAYLGSGFHVYMDNFYTSPKLFRDLYKINVLACGTYRDKRKECPQTTENALTKRANRGSIRWIRQGPLVFVKWMDTREVSVCSTIHKAFDGATVQRRMKGPEGKWTTKSVPCPTPVVHYNKYMGGVDLSDQLIQYYSVHHRSNRWYRTLFFHFMDIAATNSYLLYKELCEEKKQKPLSHRGFLEELAAQLCGVTVKVPPERAQGTHMPMPISETENKSLKATVGRKKCILCRTTRQAQQSTPWKCELCNVALCLVPDRNCFKEWHK